MGSILSEISSRHFASQIGRECPAERLEALDALEARGDHVLLIKKAVALLDDSDDRVRDRAAEVLGSVASRDAAESIVEALETLGEEGRNAAVKALAGIGKAAVPPLVAKLTDDMARVRAAAVKALGLIPVRSVLDDIAIRLSDRNPDVVREAATAIGRHRSRRHVDDLKVVYRRVPEAREAVTVALEDINRSDSQTAPA